MINSYQLKNIALLTMIIDHFGYTFFPKLTVFRLVGRISFILYAFLISEGIHYTSSLKKYLKKLLFFALISEIPFDLLFNNDLLSFKSQNIFFTLFISVLSIHLYNKVNNLLYKIYFILMGGITSFLLNFDYSWYGVMIIYIFYFFKKHKLITIYIIQLLTTIYVVIYNNLLQFFSFLGLIFFHFYNGKKGKKTGNLYYSFYVIHILVFYFVREMFFD